MVSIYLLNDIFFVVFLLIVPLPILPIQHPSSPSHHSPPTPLLSLSLPGAILFCSLVLAGQTVFAIGVQSRQYWLAVTGRFIFGLGGESLTVAQNTFCARWAPEGMFFFLFLLLLLFFFEFFLFVFLLLNSFFPQKKINRNACPLVWYCCLLLSYWFFNQLHCYPQVGNCWCSSVCLDWSGDLFVVYGCLHWSCFFGFLWTTQVFFLFISFSFCFFVYFFFFFSPLHVFFPKTFSISII